MREERRLRKTGMQKALAQYGDPEFAVFLRKAFIKAMGYTEEALDRPIIGIVNTASDYNACHQTVPDLIAAASRRMARAILGLSPIQALVFAVPATSTYQGLRCASSICMRSRTTRCNAPPPVWRFFSHQSSPSDTIGLDNQETKFVSISNTHGTNYGARPCAVPSLLCS